MSDDLTSAIQANLKGLLEYRPMSRTSVAKQFKLHLAPLRSASDFDGCIKIRYHQGNIVSFFMEDFEFDAFVRELFQQKSKNKEFFNLNLCSSK